MMLDHGDSMDTSDDHAGPLASTPAANPLLHRMRQTVMSRVFGDARTPERIGRYEIERAIGAGAMGAVFAAHDPQLDRQVAVKLLRFTSRDAEGMRLLREAKALAKLSHRNVVQVYDAGAVDDRVFLAMELVQGTDLHHWLRARPRAWREVVDVFLAAGRGLAAAHAVGLVHRDFKPQNVLVGDDGEVKVADFGLVRAAAAPGETSDEPHEPALVAGDESLTRTGTSVGTPAYMAPEQHLVLATDARTDQFSFCVALYEGLVGERPFRADSLRELIEATRADRVVFPRRPWVPVGLRRVIRRGLRANPADRFPDMPALLGALDRVRRPGWRGWAVGVAAAGLVPLVGGGLLSPPEAPAPAAAAGIAACDAEAKTRSIWGDEARERVRAQLVSVDSTIGERAANTAAEALDGYLQAWSEAYTSTCEAEPAADEAQVMAQQLCLQSRLQEARGVIAVLDQADVAIVANVSQLVAALEPVTSCMGELAVVRTASTVDDALSFELARARSLWHARQPVAAHAAAVVLAERAADAGERMLESEAWLLAGMIATYDVIDADDRTKARHALTAALTAAQAVGDPTQVLRAEVLLAGAPEDDKGTTVRADQARLAARVEASADPIATWAHHFTLSLPFVEPDGAKRKDHARRMLAVASESFGAGHRFVELSQRVAQMAGIVPRATAEQQRSKAGEVAAMFGDDSPRAVEEREDLAYELEKEGKLDEARVELERAVAAWAELVGPESTQVGSVWRRIAGLERRRGDHEAALVAYARASAAFEPNPVVDHKGENDVSSSTWFERADLLLELGRVDEAVAALEEGKRRRHPRAADGIGELLGGLFGRARLAAGDPEGALAEYATARASWAGREDVARAFGIMSELDVAEGEVLLALGRTDAARVLLREAWTRIDAQEPRKSNDQLAHARTGLALARVLAASNARDPEIATLVAAALASLPAEGGTPRQVQLRDSLVALQP